MEMQKSMHAVKANIFRLLCARSSRSYFTFIYFHPVQGQLIVCPLAHWEEKFSTHFFAITSSTTRKYYVLYCPVLLRRHLVIVPAPIDKDGYTYFLIAVAVAAAFFTSLSTSLLFFSGYMTLNAWDICRVELPRHQKLLDT